VTGPITQKELTKRLRELERSGLVHRQVYAEVPPRVEYRLTDLGGTLMPALEAFSAWAEKYGRLSGSTAAGPPSGGTAPRTRRVNPGCVRRPRSNP